MRWDAGEQDRLQVGACRTGTVQRGQLGNTPGTKPAAVPQFGMGDVVRELLVGRRRQRVPQSFLAHRVDDLVEQRVAEPRHLPPRPAVRVPAWSASHIMADWRYAASTRDVGWPCVVTAEIGTWMRWSARSGHWCRSRRQPRKARQGARRWCAAARRAAGRPGRRSRQVDVEPLGPLPGEHGYPVAQVWTAQRPAPGSSAWTAARCCTAGRPGWCRASFATRWSPW